MPKAALRLPGAALTHFDGLLTWTRAGGRAVRYLVEEKRHLRTQDVAVVVRQLVDLRQGLPKEYRGDRLLMLAPYIRAQQAAVLEEADVDYADLVGNVHLQATEFFVHVQGRQPPKELAAAPARPQKGWIKTVMAILIRPELVNAPYRLLTDKADAALGTVAACINDLILRGLVADGADGRRMIDRQGLLALWVQAYVEGLRPRLETRRFQVRAAGKKELWTQLQVVLPARGQDWALTGADAAGRRNQLFRAQETEIYAPIAAFENRGLQKALVAQPAAREGNLLVIEPPGPLAVPKPALQRPPVAPDLLAYAELRYRGTTQALEAAEQLLPGLVNDAQA
jgi:hypothetical protein